jgi:hypothetical protein
MMWGSSLFKARCVTSIFVAGGIANKKEERRETEKRGDEERRGEERRGAYPIKKLFLLFYFLFFICFSENFFIFLWI